ncbi:glycoside hydrolase family 75 protein [Streptomyces sp. NPDC050560]|uniref:glycoside hydrolase family 75 protein n=1 Tax=Streptomyces sp. NPDC050560 TaxID=3365630 RepID=UPI0037A45D0B
MHARPVVFLAALAAVALAPGALRLDRQEPHAPVVAAPGPPPARAGVSAAELLAATADCDQISDGRYPRDEGGPEDVPVCGTPRAVHWEADLDIDCDGEPGAHCNADTDPLFAAATAVERSGGGYLSAERTPYVVVPGPGGRWDPAASGVRGGEVAALVHHGRIVYAVVGDTGPADVIGEASYAAARALGITADPAGGGAADGVTYVVFRNTRVAVPEDPAAAAAQGRGLARDLVRAHTRR